MKKVLVITYYWPPAGGPGVQRWLKFVSYLRDFDIEPIVYIPENPHYPIRDESLVKELPRDLKIYKHPIKEPYGLAGILSSKKTKRMSTGIIETKNQTLIEKLLLYIRGNFFIPDARKNWVLPSIKFLKEVIQKEEITTLITTGPPHSVHLIGHGLQKELKLKWIADFRDPWTSIGYHKKLRLNSKSIKKHKELEQKVLTSADALIVTSETTKVEFSAITQQPIHVITNGYESEYEGGANLDSDFSIAHIGSLLTGRNPKNLWKVLHDMVRDNHAFRKDLRLEFIGVVSKDVLETMYKYELAPYIKIKGYVSHAEALRKQQRAQMLLLIEIDSEETKGIVPGKLFEYMAARRPILALGPEAWDAGKIIAKTESGSVFTYDSTDALERQILRSYTAFKKQKLHIEAKDIAQYSRRALTQKLAELL